jgi:glycosyltransferase involved in cell wall biosynthesis
LKFIRGKGEIAPAVKFSLIIPSKGRGDELARAIESLLQQTCQDFEIMVSDQNTDDRVADLLAARGWTGRVRLLKSSAGASRARNEGIAVATGEILGFPDDDCAYPPTLLANIARFFDEHPNYGFLTGRSFADDGGDAASRHGREPGPIRRETIYHQVIEAAFWVRRANLGPLRFDENLGTGAVTPWQADEGPDLILRLEEVDVHGFYDPTFAIWHPRLEQRGRRAIERSYRYACGSGYFLRKHRYSRRFFYYLMLRAGAGAALSLVRFSLGAARFYWARVRGLWRGWHGFPG